MMQGRQLVPFSVSKLHFTYNIALVLARTRLTSAVARRHGQHPEVDLYHLTPLLGAFQVGTHGRGSSWVVLFLWTCSPFPNSVPLLPLLFSYLIAVSSIFLPQPVLFTFCASQFSSPATGRGRG